MDEVVQARRAAREAIEDITPDRLRAVIDAHLEDASMVPGVLTTLSATVVAGDSNRQAVTKRAAGVQLIYDGLRITRDLVETEPWGTDGDDLEDDLRVLAADVMVSRGFNLLSHTEAADKAVETVREFGREQTDIHERRGTSARSLETNVFELAAIAGATATGNEAPLSLRRYVMGLARSLGDSPLGPTDEVLPDRIEEVMIRVGAQSAAEEGIRTPSATDT